jgi:hypothetical protein
MKIRITHIALAIFAAAVLIGLTALAVDTNKPDPITTNFTPVDGYTYTLETTVSNRFLTVSAPQTNGDKVIYTLTFSTNAPEPTVPQSKHNQLLIRQYQEGFVAGVSNAETARLKEQMPALVQRAVGVAQGKQ